MGRLQHFFCTLIVIAAFPGARNMAAEPPLEAEAAASAPDAADVVHAYFAGIRARDTEISRLFHSDAVLNGLGMRTHGQDAIRRFYDHAIAAGGPQPRLVGSLLRDGSRIAAEISIDLVNGETLHVIDLFVVEQGLIRSLTYFLANEPRAAKGTGSYGQSEDSPDSEQLR